MVNLSSNCWAGSHAPVDAGPTVMTRTSTGSAPRWPAAGPPTRQHIR